MTFGEYLRKEREEARRMAIRTEGTSLARYHHGRADALGFAADKADEWAQWDKQKQETAP